MNISGLNQLPTVPFFSPVLPDPNAPKAPKPRSIFEWCLFKLCYIAERYFQYSQDILCINKPLRTRKLNELTPGKSPVSCLEYLVKLTTKVISIVYPLLLFIPIIMLALKVYFRNSYPFLEAHRDSPTSVRYADSGSVATKNTAQTSFTATSTISLAAQLDWKKINAKKANHSSKPKELIFGPLCTNPPAQVFQPCVYPLDESKSAEQQWMKMYEHPFFQQTQHHFPRLFCRVNRELYLLNNPVLIESILHLEYEFINSLKKQLDKLDPSTWSMLNTQILSVTQSAIDTPEDSTASDTWEEVRKYLDQQKTYIQALSKSITDCAQESKEQTTSSYYRQKLDTIYKALKKHIDPKRRWIEIPQNEPPPKQLQEICKEITIALQALQAPLQNCKQLIESYKESLITELEKEKDTTLTVNLEATVHAFRQFIGIVENIQSLRQTENMRQNKARKNLQNLFFHIASSCTVDKLAPLIYPQSSAKYRYSDCLTQQTQEDYKAQKSSVDLRSSTGPKILSSSEAPYFVHQKNDGEIAIPTIPGNDAPYVISGGTVFFSTTYVCTLPARFKIRRKGNLWQSILEKARNKGKAQDTLEQVHMTPSSFEYTALRKSIVVKDNLSAYTSSSVYDAENGLLFPVKAVDNSLFYYNGNCFIASENKNSIGFRALKKEKNGLFLIAAGNRSFHTSKIYSLHKMTSASVFLKADGSIFYAEKQEEVDKERQIGEKNLFIDPTHNLIVPLHKKKPKIPLGIFYSPDRQKTPPSYYQPGKQIAKIPKHRTISFANFLQGLSTSARDISSTEGKSADLQKSVQVFFVGRVYNSKSTINVQNIITPGDEIPYKKRSHFYDPHSGCLIPLPDNQVEKLRVILYNGDWIVPNKDQTIHFLDEQNKTLNVDFAVHLLQNLALANLPDEKENRGRKRNITTLKFHQIKTWMNPFFIDTKGDIYPIENLSKKIQKEGVFISREGEVCLAHNLSEEINQLSSTDRYKLDPEGGSSNITDFTTAVNSEKSIPDTGFTFVFSTKETRKHFKPQNKNVSTTLYFPRFGIKELQTIRFGKEVSAFEKYYREDLEKYLAGEENLRKQLERDTKDDEKRNRRFRSRSSSRTRSESFPRQW